MVEEIVNNIIEAEDRADEIVRSAKEEAKAMLEAAQKASESRRAACVAENRALAEEKRKASVAAGQAEYDKILSEGKKLADAKSEGYRQKTEEAVQAVFSAIIA